MLLAVVVGLLGGYAWLCDHLRQRLVRLTAEKAGAALTVGRLWYVPPFTLKLADVRLVRDREGGAGNAVEMNVRAADLKLAEFPLGGPLLIQHLIVREPVVRFTRLDSPAPEPQPSPAPPAPPPATQPRLSDLFRLRRLIIHDGRVEYVDGTRADGGTTTAAEALVWRGISVDLSATPRGPGAYGYTIEARNEPIAALKTSGTINIDTMLLDVGELALDVTVRPPGDRDGDGGADESPLPPALHATLRRFEASGTLAVRGSAMRVPLRDFTAKAGELDYSLSVVPTDLTIRPPAFPVPLRDVRGGRIGLRRDGVVELTDLSARYGDDEWRLERARVPLANVTRLLHVQDVAGAVVFRQPSPDYPSKLRNIVALLNPSGPFGVAGDFAAHLDTQPKPLLDYRLSIASGAGSAFAVQVGHERVPITAVRGSAKLVRGQVLLEPTVGQTLGGEVEARGSFLTAFPGRGYGGDVALRFIDVERLSSVLHLPPPPGDGGPAGRAFLEARLQGGGFDPETTLDTLRAAGELEVLDGAFGEAPLLRAIFDRMKVDARDAITVDEAAAVFEVADRVVRLKRAAVGSPAVGLQGGGRIGFDGGLELDVVAAPLSDWRQRLRRTRVPVVSDVLGAVAGGVQDVLNLATRGLIYEFRVDGHVGDPRVRAVPTPVLSEAAAVVFSRMLRLNSGKPARGGLLKSLRADDREAGTP